MSLITILNTFLIINSININYSCWKSALISYLTNIWDPILKPEYPCKLKSKALFEMEKKWLIKINQVA